MEEAIRFGQVALETTLENRPNRAERLNNMGAHFQQRFLRIGKMKDLEKAIELGQLALNATQEDHPNIISTIWAFVLETDSQEKESGEI